MTEEEQKWVEDMKRRISIALKIPWKYLKPPPNANEALIRERSERFDKAMRKHLS